MCVCVCVLCVCACACVIYYREPAESKCMSHLVNGWDSGGTLGAHQ